MTSFGIPFEKVGETGTLASINGGKGKEKIYFITDIDTRTSGIGLVKPYASKRPRAKPYLRGHDSHNNNGVRDG